MNLNNIHHQLPRKEESQVIPNSSTRIFGLDILRCYSIIVVVIIHSCGSLLHPNLGNKLIFFVNTDPVGIFFILSGYLTGKMLIKNQAANNGFFDLKEFLTQRLLRILPLYYFVLALTIILNFIFLPYISTKDSWPYFLFLQNLRSYDIYFFPESWSLTIEFWFYLFAAFSFLLISKWKKSPDSILYISLFIIFIITALKIYKYDTHPPKTLTEFSNDFKLIVSTSIDFPAYGVLAAWLEMRHKNVWLKYRKHFFAAGIGIILSFNISILINGLEGIFNFIGVVMSNFIISLYTILLFPFLSQIKMSNSKIGKAVSFVAVRSYSIYLIHYCLILNFIFLPVMNYFNLRENGNILVNLTVFVAFWIVILLFSSFSYRYLEQPTTAFRKKLLQQTHR